MTDSDQNAPIVATRSRAKIDADLETEFRGWIDERTADLVEGGLSPAEARARALAEFGDLGAAHRYCAAQDVAIDGRARWSFMRDETISDIRIAGRTLRRTPTVTAVVLLTFALGIGAMTAVFSAVHGVLLRPLPVSDERSLVALHGTQSGAITPVGQLSAGAMVALRERASTFLGVAALAWGGGVVVVKGEPEAIPGGRITANAFNVLGVRAAIGRTFAVGEDSAGAPPVVVLSDGLWRRRFGADSGLVGKMLDVSGVQRLVLGVMPPDFRMPMFEETQLWTPLNVEPILRDQNRRDKFRFVKLVARIRAGVGVGAAQADADRVMAGLAAQRPDAYDGMGARLVPVRDEVVGDVRARLLVLLGASAFLLVIACANIAGVLLSRAAARRHELAVRVALGAGRGRLVRQFLTEGALLSAVGSALGLAFATVGIAALRSMSEFALPAEAALGLESRVVFVAIGAAAVGGLFFSAIPAIFATQLPSSALGGDGSRGSARGARKSVRTALVVGQIAITVALLVGAGLLTRSLHNLFARDLGYRTTHILSFQVSLPGTRYADNAAEDRFWSSLYGRLAAAPGVASVGGAGNVPLGGSSGAGMVIEGRPETERRAPEVRYLPASDNYFATLSIPIVRGRAFGPEDHDGVIRAAIVNASAARRFWPSADPVGARIRLGPDPGDPWWTVVGVSGDVREGVDLDAQPTVYTTQRQDHWRSGAVVIQANGDPAAIAGAVRAALHDVDPLLPAMDLRSLDDWRSMELAGRRLPMQLMIVFGVAALFLSAVGVYGVCAYAVEARTREFGIRMALGASRGSVLRNALRDGVRAAALGVAIGVPLTWVMVAQLGNLLYEVRPTDPLTLGLALALLLLAVLVAAIVPARRATKVNPLVAMRTE